MLPASLDTGFELDIVWTVRSSGIGHVGDLLADVQGELQRLRQGVGIEDAGVVTRLLVLHQLICGDHAGVIDGGVSQVQHAVRAAIDDLGPDLRRYALVDFNLDRNYSGGTLTQRQGHLAADLKCDPKTVRRHAGVALDAIAVALASGTNSLVAAPVPEIDRQAGTWQETLSRFWSLRSGVEVVCSEIPEGDRPSYASPTHHNYLYYARFVDLDSLIYVGRRFVQTLPTVDVRELQPSQYGRLGTATLLVLGGPPYNRVFRQYQDQLEIFEFELRPTGQDDPLVIKPLGSRRFGPRWTRTKELLTDVSVFVRLTLTQGNKVFLAAGCLTLGVLGASMCFLHGEQGAGNVRYIDRMVEDRDFIMVAEVGRGGIDGTPNMSDLAQVPPMLLISRDERGAFEDVVIDNTGGRDYPAR